MYYKSKTFYFILIPKLIISVWFASIDHVGYGGDSLVYSVFGHDLASVYRNEMELEENKIETEHTEEEFVNYSAIVASMYQLNSGDIMGLRNNTVPIILYHSLVYFLFWDSNLIYLIILNIFYSLVLFKIIKENRLNSPFFLLLIIFNPFSLYYGSTHMKEGLIEPLILGAYFEITRSKIRWYYFLFHFCLLAFFRLEFAVILLLAIFSAKYLQRINTIIVLIFFSTMLYIVGPADMLKNWVVSFALPLPGLYSISYFWPSGIFLNFQGILHLGLLACSFLLIFFKSTDKRLKFIIIVTSIISLNGLGMVGMKDRFISSFVTLFLILIYTVIRSKKIA